jgi:arabinan endo-1,5-alpha-L-arabinosidase
LPLIFIAVFFLSCKAREIPTEKLVDKGDTYINPVVDYGLPDPTIIKAADGCF